MAITSAEPSPIATAEPAPIAHQVNVSSTPEVTAEPTAHKNGSEAQPEPIGHSTVEPQPEHHVNNTLLAAEPEPTGHPAQNVTLKTAATKKAGQAQPQAFNKAGRTGMTEAVLLVALLLAFLFCFVPSYADFFLLCGCFTALIVTPAVMGILLELSGGDLTFGQRGGLFFGYQHRAT